MSRYALDILIVLLIGILIGYILADLRRPQETPPPKGAKTSKVWDTKDLDEIRRNMGKATG